MAQFYRFLLLSSGPLLELLYAAGLIERTLLTGIERVRLRRDFDDELWVLLFVLPHAHLRRVDG